MALAPSGGLPVDGLRQREQQGAVGVGANRITTAFVRPVECADAIVFAIAKCRLAPNVDAKFTVSGGRPCVLVHELGRLHATPSTPPRYARARDDEIARTGAAHDRQRTARNILI